MPDPPTRFVHLLSLSVAVLVAAGAAPPHYVSSASRPPHGMARLRSWIALRPRHFGRCDHLCDARRAAFASPRPPPPPHRDPARLGPGFPQPSSFAAARGGCGHAASFAALSPPPRAAASAVAAHEELDAGGAASPPPGVPGFVAELNDAQREATLRPRYSITRVIAGPGTFTLLSVLSPR